MNESTDKSSPSSSQSSSPKSSKRSKSPAEKTKSSTSKTKTTSSPLLPAKLIKEDKTDSKNKGLSSSSWVKAEKKDDKEPRDRKISQERIKVSEDNSNKNTKATSKIEIFNKDTLDSKFSQGIAEVLASETEGDQTILTSLKTLDIKPSIFEPFDIEWRPHVLPDKVEASKNKWKTDIANKNSAYEHLLIIGINYTHHTKWQIVFYGKKEKSSAHNILEETLTAPNISSKSMSLLETEISEIEVLPSMSLYRLLEAKSQSFSDLNREEALILTNAVCKELGKVPHVPLFRPLSWTSQDLAEYIQLMSMLQEKAREEEIKKELEVRFEQAVEFAQTMVKIADFSQCINEEKCSQLLQELLPLANCGHPELYRQVLEKVVNYYAEGNISISLTALEGMAYLLRLGACYVLLWPQSEGEIELLKITITKIWRYIQEEYEMILSQDQEIFQYYYLSILTALSDFAVSLHIDKLKEEFKEIVEDHLQRYKGTRKAYDVEYLAEYYKGALEHIETDLPQVTQWVRQFKQVLKFAVVIKDFATFQWDASDLDNLLEGMKSAFDAGKAIANIVDESMGLRSESNLKAMYSRVRIIRDTLDMLNPSAFIKIFSEKETIYLFLKKLLAPTLGDQKEARVSFKEVYTVLIHLENRLTTGNVQEVEAALTMLGVLQEMALPYLQQQDIENPLTVSSTWHMLMEPEKKKIFLDRSESLYGLVENHVKRQAQYLEKSEKDKNKVKEKSEDIWSRLGAELAQRESPESEKAEVTTLPQPIKTLPQLPSSEEALENTLYLSYSEDSITLHYGFKGEKNKWISSQIEASECKLEEIQALGLLQVKTSKNNLPPHAECLPFTLYLHLMGNNYVEQIKIKYCLIQGAKKEIKQEDFSLNDLKLTRQEVEFSSILKKLSGTSKSRLVKALISHPKLKEFKNTIESQRKISPGNNAYQVIEKRIARHQESFLTMLKRQGQQLWVNANTFMGKQIEKQALRLYKPQQLKLGASASLLVQVYKSEYRLAYDIEQLLLQQKVEVYGDGEGSGISKELESYIPAEVTVQHLPDPKEEELKSLDKEVKQFLEESEYPETCLFLLQGDSGMGKSLFLRYLENLQWQKYENLFSRNGYQGSIPLYIPLANLPDPNYRAIQQILEQKGWSEESIRALMMQQKENNVIPPKVIILLDGYDEINTRRNIFESNQLAQWKGAKTFLTSRIGYADAQGYQNYFEKNRGKKGNFITERYLAPFTEHQQTAYLVKQVARLKARGEETWSVEDYKVRFKEVETLNHLAKTPFLLSILVQVLPEFPKDEINLTRAKIFAQFLKHWFRNAEHRIEKHDLPERYDLQGSFLTYTYELAKTMWLENRVAVGYKRPGFKTHLRQGEDPFGVFFGTKEDNVHAWVGYTGSPVRTINNKVRFVHKSVQEYGVAFALYQALKNYRKQQQRAEKGKAVFLALQHILNQKTLSEDPEIVSFLSEMLEEERNDWYTLLLDIVRQSRDEAQSEAIQIASANAMTILNALNYAFSYEDLSGIKIPGARLEGGNFYRTKFNNSELRNVHLARAYLVEADFTGCLMEGVDLDALPSMTWEQPRDYILPQGKTFQTTSHLVYVGKEKNKIIAILIDKEKLTQRTIVLRQTIEAWEKISVSPDGEILTLAFNEGNIFYWNLPEIEPKSVVLKGPTDIYGLLFSFDSKILVARGDKGQLFWWNIRESVPTRKTLQGHTEGIQEMVFSPDSQTLVTIDFAGKIFCWNINKLESIGRNLNGYEEILDKQYLFNSDSKIFVVSGRNGNLCRWDLHVPSLFNKPNNLTSQSVILKGHVEEICKLILSSNDKLLVSADTKGNIFLWNIWRLNPPQGFPIHGQLLKGHECKVLQLSLSSDSKLLVSGDTKGNIFRWDIDINGKLLKKTILKGHENGIKQLTLNSDGSLLLSVDIKGNLYVWDMHESEPNAIVLKRGSSTTTEMMFGMQLLFKEDEKLITGDINGTITIFDLTKRPFSGERLVKQRGKIIGLCLDDSNPNCLTILSEYGLNRVNIKKEKILKNYEAIHPTSIMNVGFTSQHGDIISTSKGKFVCWESQTGKALVKSEKVDINFIPDFTFINSQFNSKQTEIIISEGGERYLSICLEKPIKRGVEKIFLTSGRNHIALSRNGKMLAAGDEIGNLIFWKIVDKQIKSVSLQGHNAKIVGLIFSPDNQILISRDIKGNLFQWSISESEPKSKPLLGYKADFLSEEIPIAFSSDSKIFVAANQSGDLFSWNMNELECKVILKREENLYIIRSLIFSPNSQILVARDINADKPPIYWNMQEKEPKKVLLEGYENPIRVITFGPDSQIFIGDSEGNCFRWDWGVNSAKRVLFNEHNSAISKLLVCPNGRTVFLADINGNLFRCDIGETEPKCTLLKAHKNNILKLVLSPDGKMLISAGSNGELFCWNIVENNPKGMRLEGHITNITHLKFASNSQTFVSVESNGTIFQWEVKENKVRRTAFRAHPHGIKLASDYEINDDPIADILYTSDNKVLITVGRKKVLCWDLTAPYPYSQDFFTLQSWPPFVDKKPTKPLPRHFQISLENPSHFEIYEDENLVQTFYFPRPITAWDITEDGEMLSVASDNMLFCWQYNSKEKQYGLLWDDGDALLCNGTIFKDVKGLSESNAQIFTQYGAVISTSTSETLSIIELKKKEPPVANFPEILEPEELESLERQLEEAKKQKQVLKQKIQTHYQALTKYSRLTLFGETARRQEVGPSLVIENIVEVKEEPDPKTTEGNVHGKAPIL
jgi:WD40 repeat protein